MVHVVTEEQSLWIATAKVPEVGTLHNNITADVAVVGAGIAGMSVAHFLTCDCIPPTRRPVSSTMS